MDYQKFFAEVADWINQVNHRAVQHGMDSDDFWKWVVKSTGDICVKYGNSKLVVKQMAMLFQWLEEVYQESKA